MRAVHLQVEYLTTPLGIDIEKPRFYWNCEGGKTQTAYQIKVEKDGELLWDSGKVASSSMTHIAYVGRALKSREHIEWSVCLWDESDVQGEWNNSWFEMGLLEKSDWRAKWISGDYKPKKNARYPVDYFRKTFLLGKEVKKARLYATARGVYDVTVNGTCIEDFILAPGMTDYRKRIQYQTYDVTELLAEENYMELRLADGWYRGSVAAYGVTDVYGSQTSVLAQLEVSFTDGTTLVVGTDDSFAWSNDGELLFADLKDGEIYDAARRPSYAGKAIVVKDTDALLVASNNVPVREKEHFTPTLLTAKDGTKVLDFGQNIAGYLKFSIEGKKGQQIKLICGETLDKDGRVDLSGIQETRPAKGWSNLGIIMKLMGKEPKEPVELTPKQEVVFICSGAKDYYKTSFAVFGFRYAQVEGDVTITPESFEAIAVYSDMEQTGSFYCSNELVNKLYQNTVWSMKSNFLDLPTDCPTRERLGWTGDAQIFFNTGAYMMDTASFFRKWLVDMEDNQYENGLLSAVIPFQGAEIMYKNAGSSVGWADAVYLIPYRYYKRFGDKTVLKKYWPMIKKYTDYLMKNLGMCDRKKAKVNPYNDYTYEKGVHLGEWLEPEEFRDKVQGAQVKQTKHPEECTAYLYLAMTTTAEIAELVGEKAYADICLEYAKGAKAAYNALFVETGTLKTNRQAKLVRPLALGLLDGTAKTEAEELLEKAVKDYQYRVGTGFLSTPFLLPTLTKAGKPETAYKMLENTRKPSWLGEVADGATTIWENWEGTVSLNHYSPGTVCQWLFDTVGGIRVDGENHFVIAPIPGGTLTEAQAGYRSLYGKVETAWKKDENGIHYTVTIPVNTTAELMLPDGRTEKLVSGKYEF